MTAAQLRKLAQTARNAAEKHVAETGCLDGSQCQDLAAIHEVRRAAETLANNALLVIRIQTGQYI